MFYSTFSRALCIVVLVLRFFFFFGFLIRHLDSNLFLKNVLRYILAKKTTYPGVNLKEFNFWLVRSSRDRN